jgi:hypothetical protein
MVEAKTALKLRCSGQPTGCDRCKASWLVCRYPPSVERKQQTRRTEQAWINNSPGAATSVTRQSSTCSTHSPPREKQTSKKVDTGSREASRTDRPVVSHESVQPRSNANHEPRGHEQEYYPMEDLLTSWTNSNTGSYGNASSIEADTGCLAGDDNLYAQVSNQIQFPDEDGAMLGEFGSAYRDLDSIRQFEPDRPFFSTASYLLP